MKSGKMMVGLAALLLLLSLVACEGLVSEFSSAQPVESVVPTHTEAVLPAGTDDGESAIQTATQESGEAAVSETGNDQAENTPTARVGLQATDPGTVALASGEIQLVEFFAFW